jgi:hypothetical protein
MSVARTWLVLDPRRRPSAAVGALLLAVGFLGVPLALLSSAAPANAASVAHSRTAHPHLADPQYGDSRPADPRYGRGPGAPERCDQRAHC